jgi:hypothetical protein
MTKTRKTYTAEFKLQAVRMVAGQHLPGRVRTPAQPDTPLTYCPFFVGRSTSSLEAQHG